MPPAAAALAVATAASGVVRRMEREYETTGTMRRSTVVAMYGTYTGYGAALAWACRRRLWPVSAPASVATPVGWVLVAGGAACAVAGMERFSSAGQVSGTEPGELHTRGIYRWSRNPQYLGNGLLVTGAAVAARSAYASMLAAGVWAIYRRWIPSEERHLLRVFGDDYEQYRRRVPRWLGHRHEPTAVGSRS